MSRRDHHLGAMERAQEARDLRAATETAGAAHAPLDGDHDVAASPQVQPRPWSCVTDHVTYPGCGTCGPCREALAAGWTALAQPTPEVERLRALSDAATPGGWHAYQTIHAEGWIVTDPQRPSFTKVADAATGADDYGRANAEFIAAAVNFTRAALAAKPTPEVEHADGDLLIRCDSLLSLIRYRESTGLSEQTKRDLADLLPPLRRRTDEIIAERRTAEREQVQAEALSRGHLVDDTSAEAER